MVYCIRRYRQAKKTYKLIFFKNGEILKKTVGYREKDELEETLKELL